MLPRVQHPCKADILIAVSKIDEDCFLKSANAAKQTKVEIGTKIVIGSLTGSSCGILRTP